MCAGGLSTNSPLMEKEHIDSADGGHDPNDPAHLGRPRTQLPQVQPGRTTETIESWRETGMGKEPCNRRRNRTNRIPRLQEERGGGGGDCGGCDACI